jgi:hypothetical protein
MYRPFLIAIACVASALGQNDTSAVPNQHGNLPFPSQASLSKLDIHIGGGPATPLNPTARFAGVSANFQFGAGYKINRHSSVVGEFLWQGLPPNRSVLAQLIQSAATPNVNPNTSVNVYSMTAEYMYRIEGVRFGFYAIGGGGWYDRYAKLNNYSVAPGTGCTPALEWWGYLCADGVVPVNNTLAAKGANSFGVNGGGGFTIRLNPAGFKMYFESRYHYAPSSRISTQLIPVTMGFRW